MFHELIMNEISHREIISIMYQNNKITVLNKNLLFNIYIYFIYLIIYIYYKRIIRQDLLSKNK